MAHAFEPVVSDCICDTTVLSLQHLLDHGITFQLPYGRKLQLLRIEEGKVHAVHTGPCSSLGGGLPEKTVYHIQVTQGGRRIRHPSLANGFTLSGVRLGDRRLPVRLNFRIDGHGPSPLVRKDVTVTSAPSPDSHPERLLV